MIESKSLEMSERTFELVLERYLNAFVYKFPEFQQEEAKSVIMWFCDHVENIGSGVDHNSDTEDINKALFELGYLMKTAPVIFLLPAFMNSEFAIVRFVAKITSLNPGLLKGMYNWQAFSIEELRFASNMSTFLLFPEQGVKMQFELSRKLSLVSLRSRWGKIEKYISGQAAAAA